MKEGFIIQLDCLLIGWINVLVVRDISKTANKVSFRNKVYDCLLAWDIIA
jgi:hypothetical protein